MPRPDKQTPYNPDRVPEREAEVASLFHQLRQALLPLRELVEQRHTTVLGLPQASQRNYHSATLRLSGILDKTADAATALFLAQQNLNTAQHQEAMAAESGAGLTEARREIERLRTTERMFGVLLQVVEWPADNIPPHIRKMQAFADQMKAKYPHGLPPLPDDWEAPLLTKRLRDPARAHEPPVPVLIPRRDNPSPLAG